MLIGVLALSPFLYHLLGGSPGVTVHKVAVISAFSGELQARGADELAAVNLAAAQANGNTTRVVASVSALDDRGSASVARDQALATSGDPGIQHVLCCSDERAFQGALPALAQSLSIYPVVTGLTQQAEAEVTLAQVARNAAPVAIVSDETGGASLRAPELVASFALANVPVQQYDINFATGDQASTLAATIAAGKPGVVVLDMDYPAAAIVAPALRHAGLTAPLLGDDRLDGAAASILLAVVTNWTYIAYDRSTLLQMTGVMAPAFAQNRGHEPASRDFISYLQAEAAFGLSTAPFDGSHVGLSEYSDVSGHYPGQFIATVPARSGRP